MTSVELRRALSETRAVLRQGSDAWSAFSCPGTAECCQLATTRREPWLWPTEWQLLLERLRRDHRPLPPARTDGGCPFLDEGGLRCTVYEDRPLGCRTFFCQRIRGPTQVPTAPTHALWERLAALNVALDAESQPRALLSWWASATSPAAP